MLNLIKDLNDRYDRLKEPARFLSFIIPIVILIKLTSIVPIVGWALLMLVFLFRIIGLYF